MGAVDPLGSGRQHRRHAGDGGLAADPPRARERFLDGQDRGHEPAVRRVREGDRLRHRRRAHANRGGFPGRAAGEPGRRVGRVHAARPRRAARFAFPLVVVRGRRQLAPSARPRQRPEGPRGLSGRARRLRGCRGLRKVGRQAPADRGRVGIRRARRALRAGLSLGQRVPGGRQVHGQHAPGPFPERGHARGRARRHRAQVAHVPAERLRPIRRRRQRLGVDQRLVPAGLLCGARERGRCRESARARIRRSTRASRA